MGKTSKKRIGTLVTLMLSGSLLVGSIASAAYFTQYPTLRSGSSGGYVESLQANLWASGHMDPVGTVDGKYGSNTIKGVKNYQTRNGLTSDGVAGSATWTNMEKYVVTDGNARYSFVHPGSTTYEVYYTQWYLDPSEVMVDYYLRYKSNKNTVAHGTVYTY